MNHSSPAFDQLRGFLKAMFQFGDNDLDFGIYRITRLKRRFIEAFIDGEGDQSLRATVVQALGRVRNQQGEAATNWLASFAFTLGDKGQAAWQALVDAPGEATARANFEKLFALADDAERERAEAELATWLETRALDESELEARVYNHLLNFFELYYEGGDFGYNTRASKAFKVPYEADYDGADTLFHWKHKDSYYIKTGNGFHSVRFEVGGKWLEFRLVDGDADASAKLAQNNNKDATHKHYRLAGIEKTTANDADGKPRELWQVRFTLASASTPKTDVYPALWHAVFDADTDLVPYLYKKPGKDDPAPGKPVFHDLAGDYDHTDGGQRKGLGQLRLKFDNYIGEIAKRDEFADCGSNAASREDKLAASTLARSLWEIDRCLNQFYVGNDADYFIHKDLQGFLTREKTRFIKNVVFSDLPALLHAGEDNLTVLIARAFNAVADRLIGFLAAIETFQKALFTMPKKVIDTGWLVSVGKIPASLHQRVFACNAQREKWQALYHVEVSKAGELAEHPALVVDTRLYHESDPDFQADLLSEDAFDHLDEQTDGLLIKSENWQALNLLAASFRHAVKCIYIDPPYNTGGDGFLYKDRFRHSSWRSMIEDRIQLMTSFQTTNGLLFSSIDDHELDSLKSCLSSSYNDIKLIPAITNLNGNYDADGFVDCHEYLVAAATTTLADVGELNVSEEALENEWFIDECGLWKRGDGLRRTGQDASRENRPNGWFPVFISHQLDDYSDARIYCTENDCPKSKDDIEIWPIDSNLQEMSWSWSKSKIKNDENDLYVVRGRSELPSIYKKQRPDLGAVPTRKTKSFYYKPSYSSSSGGTTLKNVVGYKPSEYTPKSVSLISDIVEVGSDPDSIILDAFAGSGTTAHAVMLLNSRDQTSFRRFILCEAERHFESVLVKRVKRVMYAKDWKNGQPSAPGTARHLVKVQALEQYEDALDNLETAWDQPELPGNVPVRYLFHPDQNRLFASLDVSRPFTQTLRTGKARAETVIDLAETWCYLQGYRIRSQRLYREFDRPYLAVESTHGALMVWRDIDAGENDTDTLKAILEHYHDAEGVVRIERLEVNFDADLRDLEGTDTTLIHADDFLRGGAWS